MSWTSIYKEQLSSSPFTCVGFLGVTLVLVCSSSCHCNKALNSIFSGEACVCLCSWVLGLCAETCQAWRSPSQCKWNMEIGFCIIMIQWPASCYAVCLLCRSHYSVGMHYAFSRHSSWQKLLLIYSVHIFNVHLPLFTHITALIYVAQLCRWKAPGSSVALWSWFK